MSGHCTAPLLWHNWDKTHIIFEGRKYKGKITLYSYKEVCPSRRHYTKVSFVKKKVKIRQKGGWEVCS